MTPPIEELTSLFPFTSRIQQVEGSSIHYVDEGQGPIILFLHAAPTSSFIYRKFIARLSKHCRCIAMDQPGFGSSVPASDFDFSLRAQSRAVEKFVQALDLQEVTVFVHDSAGPIGLGAAGRDPQRYRGAIITDTFGFPLKDYRFMRMMLGLATSAPSRFLNRKFNLLPWMVSTLAPVRTRLSKQERAVYRALFPTAEKRDRILDLFGELVKQQGYLEEVETGIKNGLSSNPALLMYGTFDPTRMVGWMKRFEGLFPNHRSVVIPWEGHFPHEGSPDTMISNIESWIKEVPGSGIPAN